MWSRVGKWLLMLVPVIAGVAGFGMAVIDHGPSQYIPAYLAAMATPTAVLPAIKALRRIVLIVNREGLRLELDRELSDLDQPTK